MLSHICSPRSNGAARYTTQPVRGRNCMAPARRGTARRNTLKVLRERCPRAGSGSAHKRCCVKEESHGQIQAPCNCSYANGKRRCLFQNQSLVRLIWRLFRGWNGGGGGGIGLRHTRRASHAIPGRKMSFVTKICCCQTFRHWQRHALEGELETAVSRPPVLEGLVHVAHLPRSNNQGRHAVQYGQNTYTSRRQLQVAR